MLTILEGQISFSGGLHDALEAISKHKTIQYGVLRITSDTGSGLVGIFCGRYITGAVMTLTGEKRAYAVKRLLSAKNGTYAFMDAMGESLPDIRSQHMAIDVRVLLDSVQDFASADLPISEESLTGLSASAEEIQLIDTTFGSEDDGEDEDFTEEERIERINQTYNRLLSLTEHEKKLQAVMQAEEVAEMQGEKAAFVADPNIDYSALGAIGTIDRRGALVMEKSSSKVDLAVLSQEVDPETIPPAQRATRDNFRKLDHWEQNNELYNAITMWAFFFIIAGVVYYFYGKEITEAFQLAFGRFLT